MARRRYPIKSVGSYKSGRGKAKTVFQLTRNAGTARGLFKRARNGKKAYIPKKYKKYVKSSGIMYNPKK